MSPTRPIADLAHFLEFLASSRMSANNLPCRTNARVERHSSNLPATIKTYKLNMFEEDYILYDME